MKVWSVSDAAETVEVTGVVVRQFGPIYPGMRCHVGLALQATSITVSGDRRAEVEVTAEARAFFASFWGTHRASPLSARNAIISAMCPQLCGLFSVKLASLLMLIGGVARQGRDGEGGGAGRVRGEIHFLLVGDPGTGKSQFQRYISKLSPRVVLTTGRTSSAAGLTAAAVKDGAHWSLEAGALVLSDGGVCCIDEFDSVRPADRTALHEAMEQQTVSVAKAGMVTTLNTRTSVFGTCNPKGHRRYNARRPLAEQLDISGPLLSRFDIVLLLVDDLNPVWDEAVADHILETHRHKAAAINAATPSTVQVNGAGKVGDGRVGNGTDPFNGGGEVGAWGIDLLRQYIAWVVSEFQPALSPAAEEVLSSYYQLRRGAAGRHAARTTLRLLESLVRVAQAHARLMARGTVELQDAVVAVALLDASAVDGDRALGLPDGVGVGAPGDGFPERPDQAYALLEAAVLRAVRESSTGLLPWHGDGAGGGAAGDDWD